MKRMIPAVLFCMAVLSGWAQEGPADDKRYFSGNTFFHVRHPGRIYGGDVIAVSGRPDSVIAGPVKAVMYVFDTLYRWHVYEYEMKRSGDSLVARIAVPGTAGFVAYKFLIDGRVDNGQDTGYFSMVFEKAGPYAPGAEAGYGLLRSPGYNHGVPGYFEHFTISDTATYMWLSNEILRHRGAARRLVLPYLAADARFKPETAALEQARAVGYLIRLKDSTDESLLKAYLICHKFLKDSVRTDSLKGVLLQRFPHGGLARQLAYVKADRAKGREEKLALGKAFLAEFPYNASDEEENRELDIDYYKVYRAILAISIADRNRDVILEYKDRLPLMNIPEAYYKAVEIPYDDWKKEDAKTVYPYAEVLYERMLYYYDHQPAEYWYYSPTEWKRFCEKTFQNYFRIHARLLMEMGKPAEALGLARRAQLTYGYHNSDLNQTESVLLDKAGKKKELDSVLMASVRLNEVTPVMLGLLHKVYKGKEEGFDAWLQSMKGPEAHEELLKQIQSSSLHMAAPDFSLRDVAGKEVRLSALKGKVVVLDFWATWCAPCKAAMAGMKLAKDKLKSDTGVVFYFIDTQETGSEYVSKSQAFIKEKGYDFSVLYDNGAKMDSAYEKYASALHTSGIPFKAIVDGNGVLRFSNIGYMGSPTGLADEMLAMIGEAKKVVRSDSVVYGHDSIRIGATLSYPADKKAHAAVVILSGTGRQDRDGTMAGHKLFAVLADSLVRSGFIVLRSDDRGVGVSNGDYELSTTWDFARDAEAAVAYLRSRKDLAIGKIGLLGHSEGGMSAGMAAAEDKDIAFVITLSSPGTTGLEALLLQNRTLVHSAAIPAVNQLRFDSINSLLFHLVAAHPEVSAGRLDTMLRKAYAGWKVWDDSVVAANHLAYGGHFFFPFESYVRQAVGPWYRGFMAYDPSAVLPRVHVPWLAINGDKDIISDGAVNLQGIAANLSKGGNDAVTTWLVPGLNHLYQHCVSCTTSEYGSLQETVAPEVVARIEEWLKKLG